MTPLYPDPLRPGDAVAVVTPSGPAPPAPRRFGRAIQVLSDLGYEVRVAPDAAPASTARRTAAERAAEINSAIHDPAVRAIFCTIGGYSSNSVLPHLDYQALMDDPKLIVGYSDLTALLLGVYARTGVITFHGPTLMPELGEYPQPQPLTSEQLTRFLGAHWGGPIPVATKLTEEFLLWDAADSRPRAMAPVDAPRWLGPARSVTGRLLGGNLDTVAALTGTGYLPNFDGAVFFWETTQSSVPLIERSLEQLDQAGVTADIAGMVVGLPFRAPEGFAREMADMIGSRYKSADLPLVTDVALGHADPMVTLPIGHDVVLDGSRQQITVADRPEVISLR